MDFNTALTECSQSGTTPLFLRVTVPQATEEAAMELLATFPKSLRLFRGLHGTREADGTYTMYPSVALQVNLQAVKGNTSNEGGVKRYRRFLELLTQRGFKVEHYMANDQGAWMTPMELDALLAQY